MGCCLWGAPLYADDLEDAQAAFEAGDYQETLLLLRPLLLEGDPDAEYLYGRMLEEGTGVARDVGLAMEHYRRAAAGGNLQARQRLELLSKDQGDAHVAEGDSVAVAWFREAAESGDPEAQFNYAHTLETGWGTRRDEAEARRWFQRAAEAGHDGAQLRLGLMMVVGAGGGRDEAAGVRWIRRAARNGNSLAEALVQDLLDAGGPVDDRLAALLGRLREAAWEGEEDAQERLEELLLAEDDGAEKGAWVVVEDGVSSFAGESASSTPTVALPDNVFHIPVSDPGRLRDLVAAYRRLAEEGDMEGQFALAVLYLLGQGVPRDREQGLAWMRRAAEQGYFPAQSYLRLAGPDFGSVPLRGSILLDWAKARALQWDPQAFYLLGRVFETGRGVQRDPTEARRWFQMAELVGGGPFRPEPMAAEGGEKAPPVTAVGGALRDWWMVATILFLAGVVLLIGWLHRRRSTRLRPLPADEVGRGGGRNNLPYARSTRAVEGDEDPSWKGGSWHRPEGHVGSGGQREDMPPSIPDPELAARRPARPEALFVPSPSVPRPSRKGRPSSVSPPNPSSSEGSEAPRERRPTSPAAEGEKVIRLPSEPLIPLSLTDIEARKVARERRMRQRVDTDTLSQESQPPARARGGEQPSSPSMGEAMQRTEEDAVVPSTNGNRHELAEVQFNIGLMFANGDGVPRNPVLAAKWFEKAAGRGHADAQFRLGGLHLTGELGEKDLAQAKIWLERAADNGHLRAKELLDKIHGRRNSGGIV